MIFDPPQVALYFALLFALGGSSSDPGSSVGTVAGEPAEDLEAGALTKDLTLLTIGKALSMACALAMAGSTVSSTCFSNVSPIPITSVITVGLATVWPRLLGPLAPAGTSMGVLFM